MNPLAVNALCAGMGATGCHEEWVRREIILGTDLSPLQTSNLDCTGDAQSAGFYHNCHCVDAWMPPPLPGQTPFFQYAWDPLFAFGAPPDVPGLGTTCSMLLILGLGLFGVIAQSPRRARIGSKGDLKREALAFRGSRQPDGRLLHRNPTQPLPVSVAQPPDR